MKVKMFKFELSCSGEDVINNWLEDREIDVLNIEMDVFVDAEDSEGLMVCILYEDVKKESVGMKEYPGAYPIKCDNCGSLMVERRRNSDGKPFWGCSKFPECKGIKKHGEGIAESNTPSDDEETEEQTNVEEEFFGENDDDKYAY